MAQATQKQVAFLRKLVEGKQGAGDVVTPEGVDKLQAEGGLTVPVASYFIEQLVRLPWTPRGGGQAVEEGWYRNDASEEYAVVKFNRSRTNKYAMIMNLAPDRKSLNWTYRPGLINQIAEGGWTKLSAEDAAAFGRLYGMCMVCGRTLTDPDSIKRGIGPICAGKF